MVLNADIRPEDWRWTFFSRNEMRCPLTGECRMDISFLDTLEAMRQSIRRPLIVSSGYRSPEYNSQKSTTGDHGPHTTGRAVDIAVRGELAYELLRAALAFGMTGIGVAQEGNKRFIHLDNLTAPDFPRPWVWSYSVREG